MKNRTSIFLLFLFIVVFVFKTSNAQQYGPLAAKAKISKNGLEVSDYKKVHVMVSALSEEIKKFGFTEEKVQAKCELRFRQAGLTPVPELTRSEYVYIKIDTVGSEFNVITEFRRDILFEVRKTVYWKPGCPTWDSKRAGVLRDNPEFVMNAVEQLLDFFINEYLKVNAPRKR